MLSLRVAFPPGFSLRLDLPARSLVDPPQHGELGVGPGQLLVEGGDALLRQPGIFFLGKLLGHRRRGLEQRIDLLCPAIRAHEPEPRKPAQPLLLRQFRYPPPKLAVVLHRLAHRSEHPVAQLGGAEQGPYATGYRLGGPGLGGHPGRKPGQLERRAELGTVGCRDRRGRMPRAEGPGRNA